MIGEGFARMTDARLALAQRRLWEGLQRAEPGEAIEIPAGISLGDIPPPPNPYGFTADEMALWNYTAGYLQEFRAPVFVSGTRTAI